MPHRLRGHPFFEKNVLKTEAHMNHLTNLQKAIVAQHLDALLLHDRQSKRYVGALPGSGVYVVVTPTQAVQIHDGRYRAEAADT